MWNVANNEGEPKRDSFIVPYIPVGVSFVFATPLRFHRNAVLQGDISSTVLLSCILVLCHLLSFKIPFTLNLCYTIPKNDLQIHPLH